MARAWSEKGQGTLIHKDELLKSRSSVERVHPDSLSEKT